LYKKVKFFDKEFVENNNLTIPSNTEIEVYEKDELILIWIYIYR